MPQAFIVQLQLFQSRYFLHKLCSTQSLYIHVCLLSNIKYCVGGKKKKNVAGLYFCSLWAKVRSKLCRPMKQRHPGPRLVTNGLAWRVLIPALSELVNGRSFPLTRFPHTFARQALLACPLGCQRAGGTFGSSSTLELWPSAWHYFFFVCFFVLVSFFFVYSHA